MVLYAPPMLLLLSQLTIRPSPQPTMPQILLAPLSSPPRCSSPPTFGPSPLLPHLIPLTPLHRAPKALQIASNLQSGIIELAWWLAPTMQQFRIRGRAFILPSPSHPLLPQFPAQQLAPTSAPFNWEDERVRIFRKMAPPLRASFVRPTPGTPLDGIDPKSFPATLCTDLEAKTEEEKKLVKEALQHLALIVIEPFEVDWCVLLSAATFLARDTETTNDRCDLGASPHKRSKWSKGKDGAWSEEEVVP